MICMYKGRKAPRVIEGGVSQVGALRSQDVTTEPAQEKDKDHLSLLYVLYIFIVMIQNVQSMDLSPRGRKKSFLQSIFGRP